MPVVLYVETNFLMSVAMGREAKGNDLLAAITADLVAELVSGHTPRFDLRGFDLKRFGRPRSSYRDAF